MKLRRRRAAILLIICIILYPLTSPAIYQSDIPSEPGEPEALVESRSFERGPWRGWSSDFHGNDSSISVAWGLALGQWFKYDTFSDDDDLVGVGGGDELDIPFQSADGSRVFPLPQGTFRVSQGFGCVPLDPGYAQPDFCPQEAPSFHHGLDLAAEEGTPVYASASGVVTFAEIDADSVYGNTVIRIDHDGSNSGYMTEYLHWKRSYVAEGEYVVAGQLIGEVGSIGYSTGPHLHFGVFDRRSGEFTDPLEWLRGSEAQSVAGGTIGSGGPEAVMQWAPLITAAAERYAVPAALIAAIITVESGGNPNAISPAGARGLMQVMPDHLNRFGIPEDKWLDPERNIDAGTRHLSELIAVHGTLTNAVGRYFGEGCDVLGTCTEQYIASVFSWYASYVEEFGGVAIDIDEIIANLPPSPSPTPSPTPEPEPTPEVTPTPSPTPEVTPTEPPQNPDDEGDEDARDDEETEPAPTPSPTPTPPSDDDDAGEPDGLIGVEGHGSIWTIDYESAEVLRIDPESEEVTATIAVGQNPYTLAVSESAVWVTITDEGTVVRIDPETNEIVKAIETGNDPRGIAVVKGGLWIANSADQTLVFIYFETEEIVDTIELDEAPCDLIIHEDELKVSFCESGEVVPLAELVSEE